MQIKCFIDENSCVWTFNSVTMRWNHPAHVEVDELQNLVTVSRINSDGVVEEVEGTYALFHSLGALSVVIESMTSTDKTVAPLTGQWGHGNETLVCGTLRIANLDIDTNPDTEFKGTMLDWMCRSLNKAVSDERAAGLHAMKNLLA